MWIQGLVLTLAGIGGQAGPFGLAVGEIDFESCELRSAGNRHSVSADCFSLSVPEDWWAPAGERIELKAARVPATGREPQGKPLLMLAGGPGQSALESFPAHIRALQPLRRDHDIILVDQRGTGGSQRLHCPEQKMEGEDDLREAAENARRCLESLDRDPRHYTTGATVRDLEAIRESLGLTAWHVYGVSYGSRVGLEYLRRHPQRIESLSLDGVVPADEILGPMIAPFAQQAVQRMVERCETSEACRQAFPALGESLDTLLADLDEASREVALRHPRTHEPAEVRLDRARVAQVIRFAAYQPELLSIMPLLIHRAARKGDWAPLASQWLLLGESLGDSISTGLHYAVICSEDVPFIEDIGGLEQEEANGFLGSDPTELLRAVCAEWPRAEVPADFHEPVRSDRPVLLMSGELDPVTPPEWGEQAARSLDNSRHITLKGKGHNVVHLGCMPFLMRDFLAGTPVDELDTDCLEEMRPTPFFLDFSGPSA